MVKLFNFRTYTTISICLFFLIISSKSAFSADTNRIVIERKINWKISSHTTSDHKFVTFPSFENALIRDFRQPISEFYEVMPMDFFFSEVIIEIIEEKYSPIDDSYLHGHHLHEMLQLTVKNTRQANESFLDLHFIPLRINPENGNSERLTHIKLSIKLIRALEETSLYTRDHKTSVLAEGDWYKIRIAESGVYRIDYDYLKSIGINPDQIDPRKIKIYGNGGGMLPMPNSVPRNTDLKENHIFVFGESDGRFDKDDYILFYGQGPHTWSYDLANRIYRHQFNYFTDYAFYFITIGKDAGLRIGSKESLNAPADISTSTYDFYSFHEKVMRNEISDYVKSGRDWFGEEFSITTTNEFNFTVPHINTTFPVNFISSVAGRSSSTNYFNITVDGNNFTQQMFGVNTSDYLADYCYPITNIFSFNPKSGNLNFRYNYIKNESSSAGWLNFITLNARANLLINEGQLSFRDINTLGHSVIEYKIGSNKPDITIWDVTEINRPFNQLKAKAGSVFSFKAQGDTLRQYVAFTTNGFKIPVFVEKVKNQNLHAIQDVDMLIITHPIFFDAAKKLADFRTTNDQIKVEIVLIDQIYNEFCTGAPDVTAVRDFVRHVYKQGSSGRELKYLLLLGNASYDYRDVLSSNTNFVPTFQSLRSHSPINSYASDDFFGFLDDNEGNWDHASSFYDKMDIAVGRIPVSNAKQANEVVDKIINYSVEHTFGDWRNSVVFVADDVDDSGLNAHFTHSEYLTNYLSNNAKNLNIEKVYMDAYLQVSTPNGHRYPDAQAAINEHVGKGALIVNYIGHGGEVGWAHERVLEISDINSWTNYHRLPIFVTATCEFSRYDDPERVSAGELVLLNPKGGGVALLSTSRVVYISGNETLTSNLFRDNLFEKVNGRHKTLGEVLVKTKNLTGSDPNTRKFILLGDPSMKIAIPEQRVVTTSVADSFKALSLITIDGEIQDIHGNIIPDFNGTVCPTIFDKESVLTTLDNDNKGLALPFKIRKNIIYKGKSTVENGRFSFSFVVPKDISYAEGKGRISYYAYDKTRDAAGYDESFIVGGTSDNMIIDNTPPQVRLFIGDTNFVSGGITNENPLFIAQIYDENGINTTGSSVGHELLAIFNDETYIIMNDYYQSVLNSYQYGEIRYPFRSLPEGKHKISLKVWDVANNSTEASIEFVVKLSDDPAIENLFNFPNPFSNHTYFSFDHNMNGKEILVRIDIYNSMGSHIHSIEEKISDEGNRLNRIVWYPYSQPGINLHAGLYLYRITLINEEGRIVQKTGKMYFTK